MKKFAKCDRKFSHFFFVRWKVLGFARRTLKFKSKSIFEKNVEFFLAYATPQVPICCIRRERKRNVLRTKIKSVHSG